MQIVDTFVVCCFRIYLADAHDFISSDADWILETVDIPGLEQGHVEAYLRRIQLIIKNDFIKKARKMLDIIHGF
jgi:hypothetical protein